MPTLEQGLISYLKGYAGLATIISTRVFGFRIPQKATIPCLTLQRVSTAREQTHDTSGGSDLAQVRIQFDAWSETSVVSKSITDQLRAALNGKKGNIGTAPYQISIQAALVEDEAPEIDPVTEFYRSRSDYFIWQTE
jgi:hypothetical protein